jgi:hypothetical protein
MGCQSVCSPILLQEMNRIWWKLNRLYYWRPKIWKEYKFTQSLWKDTRLAYDEIRVLEKKFMTAISKNVYDESSMKGLERLYLYLSAAWARIKCVIWGFDRLRYKHFRPTVMELSVYQEYREAAYQIFYRCSESMIDAMIKSGQTSPSRRAVFLEDIVYHKDNRRQFKS